MEIRPGIFIKKEAHQRIWIIDEPHVSVVRQNDDEFILYSSDLSDPIVAFVSDKINNPADLLAISIGTNKGELLHIGAANVDFYVDNKEILNNGSSYKLA